VVTVGLSNALSAGDPPTAVPAAGTINVCTWVSVPLTSAAMVETLALVSEARTAAVLQRRIPSTVSERPATGTGTDCVVVACPRAPDVDRVGYAGKHTAIGSAVGSSVREAMDAAL